MFEIEKASEDEYSQSAHPGRLQLMDMDLKLEIPGIQK